MNETRKPFFFPSLNVIVTNNFKCYGIFVEKKEEMASREKKSLLVEFVTYFSWFFLHFFKSSFFLFWVRWWAGTFFLYWGSVTYLLLCSATKAQNKQVLINEPVQAHKRNILLNDFTQKFIKRNKFSWRIYMVLLSEKKINWFFSPLFRLVWNETLKKDIILVLNLIQPVVVS